MRMPPRLRWLLRRARLRRSVAGLQIHFTAVSDEACTFGEHVRVAARTRVHHATLGDYSYVAAGSRVAYADIGKFCSIGPEVMLGGLGKHPVHLFSTHPFFYSSRYRRELGLPGGIAMEELPRTTVGNDVWIGARAIILDGVRIGDGAIVAAGALVAKDVPPYTIVAGLPARPLRRRDATPAALGVRSDWWNLPRPELEILAQRLIAGDPMEQPPA